MDNEISAVMTATMSKIKEMVDTNTVVGEPITTPDDITLIPLSRVSFAFASTQARPKNVRFKTSRRTNTVSAAAAAQASRSSRWAF